MSAATTSEAEFYDVAAEAEMFAAPTSEAEMSPNVAALLLLLLLLLSAGIATSARKRDELSGRGCAADVGKT
jgi:DMSO/TMAO reductase YedYZ heme-binding membrane subunit